MSEQNIEEKNIFENFTNLYSVSKTLRFELKPIGKTRENIEQHILEEDKKRAENYKKVKKIIDEYHKAFIERVLKDFKLKYNSTEENDSLEEYDTLYRDNKTDKWRDNFESVQNNLRKQIVLAFEKDEKYGTLFKKELITNDLPEFFKDNEEKRNLIEKFNKFTTYFSGFHDNRKNMYSPEAKSTAIAYRLIHENLPKFIDNIKIFGNIKERISDGIQSIYSEYSQQQLIDVKTIDEIFSLNYFNKVLTQKQIDLYNAIIGGMTEKDRKIQGINEYINLYNQKQKEKKDRLPKLKPLFKQILSDREQISWLPEAFSNDNELLQDVKTFYKQLSDDKILEKVSDLFKSFESFDISKIYIKNDTQLTDLSKKIFGDWNFIRETLEKQYETDTPRKKKQTEEKYEEQKEKYFKSLKSISISSLNSLEGNLRIQDYFAKLGATDTEKDLISKVEKAYENAERLLNDEYPKGKKLSQDKENVTLLKNLLDCIKDLQKFIKPLLGNGDESDKDEKFYGEIAYIWEILDKVTPLYNKVRNYVTRKPYSIEKFKLNFENTELLKGWDVNKEKADCCVLLRKDGLYYLAIMDKEHKGCFAQKLPTNGECYEKMDYKLLPGANKMLPKVFFSKKRINDFSPSEQLMKIYNDGTYKKGEHFNKEDCHKLIDFFKTSINKHEDWKNFDFQFSDTKTYEDLSGFYREVENQGYKVTFRNVSVDYVNSLVSEGKLYLFQIYNKDFSQYSKGTCNMHTLYWKMLFDEKNLANVVYKLNGEAEVFFRKKSIEEKITHPKNQPIDNKNSKNSKKTSKFEYDLIKDRRFATDKFQFHVPITLNFKSSAPTTVNDYVKQYVRGKKDINLIGIDRGERNLLYYSVIDSKGRILEQGSLNIIQNKYKGNIYETDYHSLLDERNEKRTKERQSWQTIENIKDLKAGYLSQAVHKITQLMVKYQAFIILEDLNIGFKRGRQKVESSVYQQFEKSLIDKLNYLVTDKKQAPEKVGGLLKAYQLTDPFESFKAMKKQNGFLLYIPAWNTSKMDPVTGFVNFLDTKYVSVKESQEFFNNFESIRYNKEKNWFEFKFDYTKFTQKASDSRTDWTLCTYGDRINTFRNKQGKWENEKINLTDEIKKHLKKYGIDPNAENLKDLICKQSDKDFFVEMHKLLRLTLQMRNSNSNEKVDYIISPIADENGNFYDSRHCKDLPKDADANGAYNIARKGLWMLKQIRDCKDGENPNLAMTNKDWLQFAQEKPYLKD